jgi:hypothetical protein
MRLRHRFRAAAVLTCIASLLAVPATASAAVRVAPRAGVLYVGTATEDGQAAGAVSVRVGPDGTSLVSLLGGAFHGDLCAEPTPLFAGPGGINPAVVTITADGRFSGSQVTAAADGARVAGTLRGRFSADAQTATATLTYSLAPISGAMSCTVTATLALHVAPATPAGKVTSPRPAATYRVVTHQGWTGTVSTDRKGKAASLVLVSAWDVCHYTALSSQHFLYPEHVRVSAPIAHGRFSAHIRYTGGSGNVDATVTGQFVGAAHHLAGALHIRRTGSSDGNTFVCDTSRVLFSAP